MTVDWMARALVLARMALIVAVAPTALAACGGEGPPPGLPEPPEPGSAAALETPHKGDVVEVSGDLGGPVAHGVPGPTCRTPDIEARIQQLVADQAKESDQLRVDKLRLTEDSNQTGWATTAADKEQHEGEVRVDQGDVDHDEIALQLTNNELAKLEALPPCRITTVASAPPAALPPPPPPDETSSVVHVLADGERVPTCDDGTAQQRIAKLHDADVEAGVQLDQAMADGDEAAVNSLNEDMDFYECWIQILSGLRPCGETASSTVGAPPASGVSAVKPIGTLGATPLLLAAMAQANYTGRWADGESRVDFGNLAAQLLIGGSSYGLVGGPKGSPTPWYQGNLELQGAWSESSSSSGRSSAGQFNVAYLMNAGQVRFGPVGGYEGSTTGDTRSHTYSYGGYAEAFVNDQFSLFGRGGGFSTSFDQSGVAAGGGLRFNPTPDVTLSATGDYARWRAPSGYYQYQATVQAEVMPWTNKPVSIFGAYTYSHSGYADFDSLHSSASELSIGLHFWANAPSPMTLEDRERNGPVVGLMPSF